MHYGQHSQKQLKACLVLGMTAEHPQEDTGPGEEPWTMTFKNWWGAVGKRGVRETVQVQGLFMKQKNEDLGLPDLPVL